MNLGTNIAAQSASMALAQTSAALARSLSQLSSGSRILNASELAMSMRFDAKIERANAAKDNVSSGLSYASTQDGYLKRIARTLDRMSELSMLSLDGTKSDADRGLYNNEFVQLQDLIKDIATKEFNGVSLFSAVDVESVIDSEGTTFTMDGIDLGASSTTYNNVTTSGTSISNTTAATTALNYIKTAIMELGKDRTEVSANISRFNMASETLDATIQTFSAASSAIKDLDVAKESTEYSKQNILNQATTAMLVQANQLPQSVLRLLPN
jgi:flagellin